MANWIRKLFRTARKPGSGNEGGSSQDIRKRDLRITGLWQWGGSARPAPIGGAPAETGLGHHPIRPFDALDVLLFLLIIGLVTGATRLWKPPASVDSTVQKLIPAREPQALTTAPPYSPSQMSPGGPERHASQSPPRPTATAPPAKDSNAQQDGAVDRPASPVAPITASYTAQARNARFRGGVFMTVTITADGTPKDLERTAPVPFDLESPASEAVRHSRFIPALRDGRPVESRILVEVRFH